MPQSDLPLPDRLEQECARAGKTRQPVFLVGADRSLLERVAKRIHALTDDSWTVGQYVSLSCRSSTLSMVEPMPGITSMGELYLAETGTIHMSDVESMSNENADGIKGKIYAPMTRARLIFSSTVDPDRWPDDVPKETLLNMLREFPRIEVGGRQEQEPAPNKAANNTWQHSTKVGWMVTFGGERERLPETKGMRAIAYLLSLSDGTPKGGASEVRTAMDGGDPQVEAQRRAHGAGQETADGNAIAQVSECLEDIRAELAAEDLALSLERREELGDKKDSLEEYLAGAVGLGMRRRTLGGVRDGMVVGNAEIMSNVVDGGRLSTM